MKVIHVLKRKKSSGVALITAILIVAIASIAAVSMIVSMNLSIHRTEGLYSSELAWWYADGVEQWMLAWLKRDLQSHDTDSLGDAWAKPISGLPIEEGFISVTLEDLQGRFNVNNLGALNPASYLEQFARLIDSLRAHQAVSGREIADAVRDFIDTDSMVQMPGGAEDDFYLRLTPAHRTAGRFFLTPTELLAVKGMTPRLFELLAPYVATLPTSNSKVNVNTASEQVLSAVLGSEGARFALLKREEHGSILQPTELNIETGAKQRELQSYIDIRTQYFLLHTTVAVGSLHASFYSVIFCPRGGMAQIISHSISGTTD